MFRGLMRKGRAPDQLQLSSQSLAACSLHPKLLFVGALAKSGEFPSHK